MEGVSSVGVLGKGVVCAGAGSRFRVYRRNCLIYGSKGMRKVCRALPFQLKKRPVRSRKSYLVVPKVASLRVRTPRCAFHNAKVSLRLLR